MRRRFLLSVLLLSACGGNTAQSDNVNKPASEVAAPAESIKPVGKWKYSKKLDEMRNQETHFVSVDSEPLRIDPYGEVTLSLVFLRHGDNPPVPLVSLSDGLIECLGDGNCLVSYKLDDGEVGTVMTKSSSSEGIMLLGCTEEKRSEYGEHFCGLLASDWHGQILKSKRMIMEVSMVNHGRYQFKFDVSGLADVEEWNKLKF